jgi:hypothetical protein
MTDQIPDAPTTRAVTAREPIYADYQAKTVRVIPLFELRRTEGRTGS